MVSYGARHRGDCRPEPCATVIVWRPFTQDADGVTARFTLPDGAEVEEHGAVLVGADGIHSVLRGPLHPNDGGLHWQGSQLWRGVTEWPAFAGGNVMVIAGDPTTKLTIYPIADGRSSGTRLTNWIINGKVPSGAVAPPREDWSRPGKLKDVLPFAKRLRLPFLDVEALIRATPHFFEYPECDRDPLPWWTQGRVTLLGDAAHPMYPTGSNGSAQAVLDAQCLAKLLSEVRPGTALQEYEAERLPRTGAVVLSNRRGGPEQVMNIVAERAPILPPQWLPSRMLPLNRPNANSTRASPVVPSTDRLSCVRWRMAEPAPLHAISGGGPFAVLAPCRDLVTKSSVPQSRECWIPVPIAAPVSFPTNFLR
jgi:2-polyprenyl-6-methoxyphenol hydroxylase-like FAD-dependent oxidoreductase